MELKTFFTIRCVQARNTLFLGAILFCFGLLFPVMESAAAPVVTIRPMVTITSRYDSNFYRTDQNEREVYTYIIRPGVQVGVATAKLAVNFSYGLDAYFYNDQSAVPLGLHPASEEDYIGQSANLDASYHLTHRLTVGIRDSFYFTRRSDRYDDFYDDADRRKHYTNRLSPQLYYDFENRFAAGLSYQWQVVDVEDTYNGDAEEQRIAFDLLYNPSRTSTLTLNYQHWIQDYKVGDTDYNSDQVGLTLQKRYKYFFFEAGGGFQNRRFKNPALEDQGSTVYRFAIGGQNPPSYNVGRRIYEEDSFKLKSHVYLDYERDLNDLDAFRTDDRFTLSVGHLFLEKIKLWLKVYHTISQFGDELISAADGTTVQREDKTTGVSGAVRYMPASHTSLYLETGLTDRSSNIAGLSYQNIYVQFGVDFSYSMGREK
jgi:hypothetical protein